MIDVDIRSLYHVIGSASIVSVAYFTYRKLIVAALIAVAVGVGKEFLVDAYCGGGDMIFNCLGVLLGCVCMAIMGR